MNYNLDYIEFKNKLFKVREICLPEIGSILVSTLSLNNLLQEDGKYISDEAMVVDEQIFYFVEEDEISMSFFVKITPTVMIVIQ